MALIKCNSCGKEISDQASSCIHCGAVVEDVPKCKECGDKIDAGETVCDACGYPIEEKEKEASVQTPVQEVPLTQTQAIPYIPTAVPAEPKKGLQPWMIVCGVLGLIIGAFILYKIFGGGSAILGTYVQEGGADATLILLKDNKCSMSIGDQDGDYPTTITNCYWSVSDNYVTINFTMSLSNAYGQTYTRDSSLAGTFDGDSITMDGGAVYYKN